MSVILRGCVRCRGSADQILSRRCVYTGELFYRRSYLDPSYYTVYQRTRLNSIRQQNGKLSAVHHIPSLSIILENQHRHGQSTPPPLFLNSRTLTQVHYGNHSIFGSSPTFYRTLHISSRTSKEGLESESKVEQTVKNLKLKPKVPESTVTLPKKSLWQRFVDEVKHYYHGFRLLGLDIKITIRLLWQIAQGRDSLTRRERRQLIRTVSDLFRLVPFLVFVIIPFMEVLLPVALKLFPGMLPSTFQDDSSKRKKLTKQLKMKLEMAKFLQETIEESAVQKKKGKSTKSAQEFASFMESIRTAGHQATNDEIIRFSKLFEDELTLDSLSRAQLVALCKILLMQPYGTNNFLRFQLRMKLRSLHADDRMIENEGVDNLTVAELQAACQARGMRALGVPIERLKFQLQQWMDLHLNEQIPTSLLLLSRTLYLPETLTAQEQLKETISTLPESMTEEAKIKIAEVEGETVDHATKLKVIKMEEEAIAKEKAEKKKQLQEEKAKKKKQEELAAAITVVTPDDGEMLKELPLLYRPDKEELVDKAPVITDKAEEELKEEVTKEDIKILSEAVCSLQAEKQIVSKEKEELEELKEEVEEYKEDVKDLKAVAKIEGKDLTESKASKRLGKKVNRMIASMNNIIGELEKEKSSLQKEFKLHKEKMESSEGTLKEEAQERVDNHKEGIVSIEELVEAINKLMVVPDEAKLRRIADVLDEDHDGIIRLEDVVKTIELIAKEEIDLNTKQIGEIMDLISKEENIENLEKDIEKREQDIEDRAGKKQ
ncbi:mitochondrial proton/calcium exchanger protein-like [Saccoglossus kowalevskii]|uniref:Mitochondrial proton/calcium exchanger protein n=1 Tax=Saccoglossus kowalevskii TaxID=10224 RepID=A0ABM0LZ02_SACKO|nr:PREDICTED: LETM1 and EF-hand domain-containing protein 1, mitochondrial-like [Saccoglossus kowalevskii]